MAFKHKNQSDTFPYPVKFTAIDGAGEQVTHQFIGIFKRKKRSEMDGLWEAKAQSEERQGKAKITREIYLEGLEADVDWVMQFTSGWGDVEVNDSTEFNRENVRVLLDDYPGLAHVMFRSFQEGNIGGIAKN